MSTATTTARVELGWMHRVRFFLAAGMVWALLHFLIAVPLLPRTSERPIVPSAAGPAAGLATIGVLWVGAAIAISVVGRSDPRQPLMVLGLALAAWCAGGGRTGGTMDQWLIQQNEVPGPPNGRPYALLLIDYAYLLVGIAGAHLIGWRLRSAAGVTRPARRDVFANLLRDAFLPAVPARERQQGVLALAVTVVLGGLGTLVLTGGPLSQTLRGQVYFAVCLAFYLAVYAARAWTQVADPRWYWPAPFLLGIVGLIVASFAPGLLLPADYRGLNIIPAWGLVRALPVEMVGAGLVGTLWRLRPAPASAGPGMGA